MKLIGLTGFAGSGKDTLADSLIELFGFTKYSLANPIKRGIETLFSLDSGIWDRHRKEEVIPFLGVSPRRLAQTLGTEWGREIVGDDVWLKAAEAYIREHDPDEERAWVIPDVRFDNEAAWVRAHGGLVVHIERPNVRAVETHSSESGVSADLIDLSIVNDGSIQDLRYQAGPVFRKYHQRNVTA